jgi:hypothetical protein
MSSLNQDEALIEFERSVNDRAKEVASISNHFEFKKGLLKFLGEFASESPLLDRIPGPVLPVDEGTGSSYLSYIENSLSDGNTGLSLLSSRLNQILLWIFLDHAQQHGLSAPAIIEDLVTTQDFHGDLVAAVGLPRLPSLGSTGLLSIKDPSSSFSSDPHFHSASPAGFQSGSWSQMSNVHPSRQQYSPVPGAASEAGSVLTLVYADIKDVDKDARELLQRLQRVSRDTRKCNTFFGIIRNEIKAMDQVHPGVLWTMLCLWCQEWEWIDPISPGHPDVPFLIPEGTVQRDLLLPIAAAMLNHRCTGVSFHNRKQTAREIMKFLSNWVKESRAEQVTIDDALAFSGRTASSYATFTGQTYGSGQFGTSFTGPIYSR